MDGGKCPTCRTGPDVGVTRDTTRRDANKRRRVAWPALRAVRRRRHVSAAPATERILRRRLPSHRPPAGRLTGRIPAAPASSIRRSVASDDPLPCRRRRRASAAISRLRRLWEADRVASFVAVQRWRAAVADTAIFLTESPVKYDNRHSASLIRAPEGDGAAGMEVAGAEPAMWDRRPTEPCAGQSRTARADQTPSDDGGEPSDDCRPVTSTDSPGQVSSRPPPGPPCGQQWEAPPSGPVALLACRVALGASGSHSSGGRMSARQR